MPVNFIITIKSKYHGKETDDNADAQAEETQKMISSIMCGGVLFLKIFHHGTSLEALRCLAHNVKALLPVAELKHKS